MLSLFAALFNVFAKLNFELFSIAIVEIVIGATPPSIIFIVEYTLKLFIGGCTILEYKVFKCFQEMLIEPIGDILLIAFAVGQVDFGNDTVITEFFWENMKKKAVYKCRFACPLGTNDEDEFVALRVLHAFNETLEFFCVIRVKTLDPTD